MICIRYIDKIIRLYILFPFVFFFFFSSNLSYATDIKKYKLSDFNSDILYYQDNLITTVNSSPINLWKTNIFNVNHTSSIYNNRINNLNYRELHHSEMANDVAKSEVGYQSFSRNITNLKAELGTTDIFGFKSIVDIMSSDIQPRVVPLTESYKIDLSAINTFNQKTVKSDNIYLSTRIKRINFNTLRFSLQMPKLVGGIILSVSASAILFAFALFCFVTFSTRRNIS